MIFLFYLIASNLLNKLKKNMTQDKTLEILKSGKSVFLTGEPGAGKTHTIGRFIEWLDQQNTEYAITASTGIAASHLDGSTIHSWSGLGIQRNLKKENLDKIKNNTHLKEKIKPVKVLVIDEVSMLDSVNINDINNILCAIHNNVLPFGGIQVVFVGDFFQLPPVGKYGEERLFAFESQSWINADLEICYLTEQHRQSDKVFLDILSGIRSGETTEEHKNLLNECTLDNQPDTKLFTHNADVDRINKEELEKLPGEEKTYIMQESGPDNLIETLKRSCLSPEKLVLKKDAVVMFTRNNFNAGYVNGSIGIVNGFTGSGDPIIHLLNGERVYPEIAKWSIKKWREEKAYIKQLPLRLAWAITVHKSQGMSLDSAMIDLSSTFEFGQGYVAISRVRTLGGLHLTGINDMAFKMHPKVVEQDIIFREKGI